MERPHLSKSKYLAGKQCLKRLWFTCLAPHLAPSPDPALQARLAAGTEIGEMARLIFPGGVLVAEPAFRHDDAVRRTRSLAEDPAVPAIFEAAFEHDRVRIRVDVLERLGRQKWGVREVKSSTSVSDVHLEDVAIQCHVLGGAGLDIGSAEVVCVDKTYVRGEGEVDWFQFFARHDVTREVRSRLREAPALVRRFHETLALPEPPSVAPWTHCFDPYDCDFLEHCTADKPKDWVLHLPGLSHEQVAALRDAAIESISAIPDGFHLSPAQGRIRDATRSGREFVSAGLGDALAGFGPPADYLDFETMNPAVPLYPGTRPYQRIPFQWSLHRVDAVGMVSHREFLADGCSDPRGEFAESLLQVLEGTEQPVIVYSSFEAGVLKELGAAAPELAGRLDGVRGRLRDLLPVVRRHVYHSDFHCSFSIKKVATALSPGFSYEGPEAITSGDLASLEFTAIARGKLSKADASRTRGRLLDYCRHDTQALLELHSALLRLAEK